MSLFALLSILVVLAALFSFVNHRYFRLPATIGIMLISLATSLIILIIGTYAGDVRHWAQELVGRIDFDKTVLHGMLAFLLFAGSLHLNFADLAKDRLAIGLLAVVGTLVSTFLVGYGVYLLFLAMSMAVPLAACMLFGALISPTDPIAVLAIMQNVGAPKKLEVRMAGESLFNDGFGVVIFLSILEVASGTSSPTVGSVLWLLAKEAGGGAILGFVCGWVTFQLLKRVDDYEVEILLTLGLAMGAYALADAVHVSAPIAAVVAGLFIGNHGRTYAMSTRTREHLDTFWKLIDGILNAILFLLLGLELLVVHFDLHFLAIGLLAIPITVLCRWISVAAVIAPLQSRLKCTPGTIRILTWGALRGGISVALALSLPHAPHRDLLLSMTYVVVVFSIAVQGLTVGPLIRAIGHPAKDASAH